MQTSDKYIDQIFDFEGQWAMPSRCGLRYRKVDGRDVVIATELYKDNPGSSIASVSASLAMQIAGHLGIDPAGMVYIESAPKMNSKLSFYDAMAYIVDFDMRDGVLCNPRWTEINLEQSPYGED